jgi:hypothetical protein
MGATILASSVLSLFLFIKGHAGLIMGSDDPTPAKEPQTLSVPEPDAGKANEVNDEEPEKADEAQKDEQEAYVHVPVCYFYFFRAQLKIIFLSSTASLSCFVSFVF